MVKMVMGQLLEMSQAFMLAAVLKCLTAELVSQQFEIVIKSFLSLLGWTNNI